MLLDIERIIKWYLLAQQYLCDSNMKKIAKDKEIVKCYLIIQMLLENSAKGGILVTQGNSKVSSQSLYANGKYCK